MMRSLGILCAFAVGGTLVAAQHSLSSGAEDAAGQLSRVDLPDGTRLAVLDFRGTDGGQDQIGRYLAEELTTHLIQTGRFLLIERTRIDSILQELRLADVEQQLVKPEFAEKFRGLLGADYIVVGSLFRARDHVALNARLLETLTGAVHAAAIVRFRIGPDGEIDTSLSGGRTQSIENATVTVSACRKSLEDVACVLNVTWGGSRGRMVVLPSSAAVQGGRNLVLRSLGIRDVVAPAGVNAVSFVEPGDTVAIALRFAAVRNAGAGVVQLTLDLVTPAGQTASFAFSDVLITQ